MKNYVVFLFQLMVWSGYTLAEWLSQHDRLLFKVIMFIVFLNVAVFIGKKVLNSNLKTFLVTLISLTTYSVIQLVLTTFGPL
ncbi:hypothetical protein [Peribacillus tepidiphilus]|uniref:hypothetical protein n=1 Tax=Peribacillus tepidiphilus TaxID=2652445 RepID=UPI00177B55FC|nr:hypothetical protein [Peribacillus tepidiphilus]